MFSASFLEGGHETVYSVMSAVFLSGSLDRPFHLCPERLVGHGVRPIEPRMLATESTSPSSLLICDDCNSAWLIQLFSPIKSHISHSIFFRHVLQLSAVR